MCFITDTDLTIRSIVNIIEPNVINYIFKFESIKDKSPPCIFFTFNNKPISVIPINKNSFETLIDAYNKAFPTTFEIVAKMTTGYDIVYGPTHILYPKYLKKYPKLLSFNTTGDYSVVAIPKSCNNAWSGFNIVFTNNILNIPFPKTKNIIIINN